MKENSKLLTIIISVFVIVAVVFSISIITSHTNYIFTKNKLLTDDQHFINPAEGKLAIIVKENGIYDDPDIENQLYEFLLSVKNDLDLDNVGIQYFNGDSLDDLDNFVGSLYYHDDVRYIIMVGRNLAWEGEDGWKQIDDRSIIDAFWAVNDRLHFRGPNHRIEGYPLYGIKDIAISWIIEPDVCYSYNSQDEIDEIKKEIILNIITTYTEYHNNFENTINDFKKSCLYVYDKEFLPDFYEEYFNAGYQFDWTLVLNTEYDKVWNELSKKHLVFDYSIHGLRNMLSIKNPNDKYLPFTVELYLNFIEKNGIPALFVDATACESEIFQGKCIPTDSGIIYCWPTVNICNGVWAYYSIGPCDATKAFSTTSPFLGYVLRNYKTNTVVFGDITAHII